MNMTRRGFSLFEAVIAAAILAVIGAAIVPSVVAYKTQQRIQNTANDLLAIGAAVQKFELTANVGKYPGRLSHLSTQYVLLTDSTSCRTTYNSAGATLAGWRVGGPYLDRVIPRTGLQLGVGVAIDTLHRSSNATTVGYLNLIIPGVAYEDALLLNNVVDGPADPETAGNLNLKGAIRWFVAPSAPNNTVSLIFSMPIANTC